MRLGIAIIICLAGAAGDGVAQESERDATRLEVGERFCRRHERCFDAVRREVAENKSIQRVIITIGETLYNVSPENSERAYDAMTRALLYTHDFLSDAEMGAGQIRFAGGEVTELRKILGDAAWICEWRGAWPSKFRCLHRRLIAFEPGWH